MHGNLIYIAKLWREMFNIFCTVTIVMQVNIKGLLTVNVQKYHFPKNQCTYNKYHWKK